MKFLQQIKLGGLALEIAKHAGSLLIRIGVESTQKILREMMRLEIEERTLTGQQKFDRLADYIRKELVDAIASINITKLLVSAVVKLFKLTGLFKSNTNPER